MWSKVSALFSVVFKSSHFPILWQDDIIIPIHKKGQWKMLSTSWKLFSRIINNRLSFWSKTYQIINDNQTVFYLGMSSVDNIYISQSVIDPGLNRGKKVFCALIDLSTALNINRDCLWYKLLNSGPRGHKCNFFLIILTQLSLLGDSKE